MTFDLADEDEAADVRTAQAVRSAVRPGTLLTITGPAGGVPAPFDVTTTRVTRLAHVAQADLVQLVERHPAWAGALLGQELWQLRNWLTWTRTRFGTDPDEDGIASVEHLIADSGPTLPVNSSLYGVPYLLRNRLTREDGFRRLYSAHLHGRAAERAVSSTALDLLRDLERGHRFFLGLQSTYDAVIASDRLSAHGLRRVSTRYFRDALHHVPWVIDGLDNLPDDPNFILIYSHMAYAAVLASGQPFSIAPEGTITEEESTTEQSPGPLKAGAFLMSERLPSRPRIRPVALANFDRPAHSAVFSCVVKPAFSMEERGVDVTDREAMDAFLTEYRQELRGYVEEAIALAEDVVRPDADLDDVVTNLGAVDVVHEEFEHDVRALELRPAPPGPDAGPTVFYGSSTFRLWRGVGDDVGVPRAVNLAFGGSTLEACRRYFERLVLRHRPARLVLYAGENDIGRGVPAEDVVDLFLRFADDLRTYLPTTECWFVSIKPSPGRSEFTEAIRAANAGVAADIDERPEWHYVDWFGTCSDRTARQTPACSSPTSCTSTPLPRDPRSPATRC